MPPQFGLPGSETLPLSGRVHVVGAGPVGLAMAALLQSNDRLSVHLYEKRREYSRTRMVRLAGGTAVAPSSY
jgi:2-polyprenyl-6-methoxyphenol hydroxylase-like FAD-dependent oxidoreductase